MNLHSLRSALRCILRPHHLAFFRCAVASLYEVVSVRPSVRPSVPCYFQTRTRRILCRVSGLVSHHFCFKVWFELKVLGAFKTYVVNAIFIPSNDTMLGSRFVEKEMVNWISKFFILTFLLCFHLSWSSNLSQGSFLSTNPLWSKTAKNTDWSTGSLARPFARSLARLLRLFPHSWDSEWLDDYFVCVFFSFFRP